MKIAVLGTSFLENYVMEELKKIRIPGSVDYYNYESFSTIGRLYAQLCSDYDGFLTSGPLPLAAIRRYVGELPRPIVPFGLDAVSYYEAFFKILYKERNVDQAADVGDHKRRTEIGHDGGKSGLGSNVLGQDAGPETA